MSVVGAVHGPGLVGRAQPISVAVIGVMGQRSTVLHHVGKPAGRIVRVHDRVRRPSDGFHLLRNPPQLITSVLHVKHLGAIGCGCVSHQFPEGAVAAAVRNSTERCPGDQSVLRTAGDRQRAC